MKKIVAVVLTLALSLTLAACGGDKKSEGVMTHAEYMAAAVDTEVVVEAYVQGHQSWWKDTVNVYAQDKDGGYYFYNLKCSEADAAKLVPGTKIKVTGYKAAWSGEIEVSDASFEFGNGKYVAKALDVTKMLGTAELESHMNEFVAFKGMKVEAQADGSAFLYNWDGSGSHDSNSDLYFSVSYNGQTYSFTVESYLCDNTTDVYKAVENLKVGDVLDMEGFLYWYNGANPHITKVVVK